MSIDARNGAVEGRISRVDPAVQNGLVLIDVTFPERATLPRGARPVLTVDGSVLLERLDNSLYVNRPSGAGKRAPAVFRLSAD